MQYVADGVVYPGPVDSATPRKFQFSVSRCRNVSCDSYSEVGRQLHGLQTSLLLCCFLTLLETRRNLSMKR